MNKQQLKDLKWKYWSYGFGWATVLYASILILAKLGGTI